MNATPPHDLGADLALAQAGDGVAYHRFLENAVPFLRQIIRRAGCREEEVEDVVQDTLLTIHQVRHTYDPSRPVKPWLTALARRRSMDSLRKTYNRRNRETLDDVVHETFHDRAANQSEDDILTARDLDRLTAALPPRQREAVTLIRVRGLTLAQASVLTGQSVNALKVSVHRGLKALRAGLAGEPLEMEGGGTDGP